MRIKTNSNPHRIFAISDLHLPGGDNKPMDVFGPHWENHFEKITQDWCGRVGEDDVVLIPGDISWAMSMEAVLPDLQSIGALPGHKIILRGNHDYWWSSLSKVRQALPLKMYALQNDALVLFDTVFCGTRGWQNVPEQSQQDCKIYRREVMRMELSLQQAERIGPEKRKVVLTHYPPLEHGHDKTPMTDLLEKYRVQDVVYGHLHGQATKSAFSGECRQIRYHFASCDALSFRLLEII